MADVSPDVLRGLLIPDPRIKTANLSSVSTYTQGTPRPGVPDDTSDPQSSMVLVASGEQDTYTYHFQAQQGGFPGDATAVWRRGVDATDKYRGWDPPHLLTNYEAIASSGHVSAHAISTDSGGVVVARHLIAVGQDIVLTHARDQDGAWSSSSTIYTAAISASTWGLHPCLVLLPSGRIMLYHWVEDSSTSEAQVRAWYSDDDGGTWALANTACLDSPVDISGARGSGAAGYDLFRLRAGYKDGQVLLVAHLQQHDTDYTYLDVLQQWASSDNGVTFDAIGDPWDGDVSGDSGGGYPDIVVANGYFNLIYIDQANFNRPAMRRIIAAQDRLGDADWDSLLATGEWATSAGGPTGEYFTDGDLAAWMLDTGDVYVAGRITSANNEGIILWSSDGETFEGLGESDLSYSGKWWDSSVSTTYPDGLTGAQCAGGSILVHGATATTATTACYASYLGGYAQVTMPSLYASSTDPAERVGWMETWQGWELPDDCGWTVGGTGGTAAIVGSEYVQTETTTGNSITYSRTPSGSVADGIIARIAMAVETGGDLTSAYIAVRLRLADGTDDYDVRFFISSVGIALRDTNAGAAIGSSVVVDTTGDGIEILVAMAGNTLTAWYRLRDPGADNKRWTLGWSSTSLTSDTATPDTANVIRWGHPTAAPADTQRADWFEVMYTSGSYAGEQLAEGQTNPDDLYGRVISGDPAYVVQGLKVAAIDGPAIRGDTWEIEPAYEYPIEAIDPAVAPSPRRPWRSTDTSQQIISWDIGESLANTVPESTSIGIYLGKINWRTATLRYVTHAGVTTTIATIDAASGATGLGYDRYHDVIAPASGTADTTSWLQGDELSGGTVDLGGGDLRRISRNTAGLWTDAAALKTRISLDEIDGSEPTSGTCNIWAPEVVVIIHDVTAAMERIELVIDAQSTADGYLEIGTCLVGWVYTFGRQYGSGWQVGIEANTDISTLRSGARAAILRGPARRYVRWSWTPIDMTDIYDGGIPDFLSGATGGEPIATPADTPWALQSLLTRLGGAYTPAVYLPRINRGGTPIHVLRRRDIMYGRLTSSIEMENVMGDEGQDDVSRIQTVTFEEEV